MQGNTLALLMKDRKSLYLLIFALIVITVAFTLISVWGYRFYFSKHHTSTPINSLTTNRLAVKKTGNRQAQHIFMDSAVQHLNDPADTITYDSSDHELAQKIREFNRVKNEIALILKNRLSAKDSSSETAIAELQRKINELQNQNDEITKDNLQLKEKIAQLLDSKQKENEQKPSSGKNKQQSALSLPLLVTHLRFAAYNNDPKTWLASETKKLTGSFEINVKPQNTIKAIYIVIVQPDGKVLLSSFAGPDTFETTFGRKHYSAVVTFDNQEDNHKRLYFSVNSKAFRKGKYVMQIYHGGIMIGRLVIALY